MIIQAPTASGIRVINPSLLPTPVSPGIRSRLSFLIAVGLAHPLASLPCRAVGLDSEGNDVPRLRVVVPDSRHQAIERLLDDTAAAMNHEDLDAVERCFMPDQRAAARRRLGMILVSHAVSLELEDHHVLECSDTHAEVGIRYAITLDGARYDIVSMLALGRHGDDWLIQREKVQTISGGPSGCGSGRIGDRPVCIGGRCSLR